ncbi:ribosomal l50, mitochondria [Trichoderma arundinaceum]|uniref:Large ribosomal subunit protein mL50 n=1 Tax=Trichoderma arundinaceum TaxID=490622 RepID=A0A395NWY3_TRIAR|nr:ribosomal l50, mitochondria [Trichoderma arundinaceum]
MARITRMRRLQSLQLAVPPQCAANRPSFAAARAISTTSPSQSKNTEWIRGKLWKGEAPGPADPYTQRLEPETQSNLPEEAFESRPREDKTPAAVRDSRLRLPSRRTEAATEKALQASDPTYVPATEADGLEEIGPLSTWWEQPGHWGEESAFKGFGSTDKVVEKEVLEVYLRRAVIEALALQQTGVFSEWATKKWSEGGSQSELEQALALQVEVQDGKATLKGDASLVVESLTSDSQEAESTARISVEEAKEIIKSWDPSWKNITLDDSLRFAIRKRLYQLTGVLIPDAKLAAANNAKHILTLAARDPKPLKLAQLLEKRSAFNDLANVAVHDRKIGPIDKEVAVGRWKVIEEELKKRDLPVTGYGNAGRNKERDWLTGKI